VEQGLELEWDGSQPTPFDEIVVFLFSLLLPGFSFPPEFCAPNSGVYGQAFAAALTATGQVVARTENLWMTTVRQQAAKSSPSQKGCESP